VLRCLFVAPQVVCPCMVMGTGAYQARRTSGAVGLLCMLRSKAPIMENPSPSVRDVKIIINPELQRRCLRLPVARMIASLPSTSARRSTGDSAGRGSCAFCLRMCAHVRPALVIVSQRSKFKCCVAEALYRKPHNWDAGVAGWRLPKEDAHFVLAAKWSYQLVKATKKPWMIE